MTYHYATLRTDKESLSKLVFSPQDNFNPDNLVVEEVVKSKGLRILKIKNTKIFKRTNFLIC